MAYNKNYTVLVQSNKVLRSLTSGKSPVLARIEILLSSLLSRGGLLSVYDELSGTQASGTVTFTGARAHGSGSSNAAFSVTDGGSGAMTVTVGSVTGISITSSGTGATDATALAAAVAAAVPSATVTANSGDVRIVWNVYGNVGNSVATVVTASGGGNLTAAGATLTGGTPTGSLGNVVVGGHTVSLGSAGSSDDVVATAAAVAAAVNGNAAASLLVSAAGSVVSHNPVLTLTAKVLPPVLEVGNSITLTASVGSAGASKLAGGVNASANSFQF